MALNGLLGGRGGGFPSSPANDDDGSSEGYGGPQLLSLPPSTPVDSNPGANSVAEGAAVNTQVGITASSHSLLDLFPVTYSLGADSSQGGFKIDPNTGVVTVADPGKISGVLKKIDQRVDSSGEERNTFCINDIDGAVTLKCKTDAGLATDATWPGAS